MVNEKTLRVAKVILATAIQDCQPKVENLATLRDSGLLAYCPICDGYDHGKDQVILLVKEAHRLKQTGFVSGLMPNLHIVAIEKFKTSKRL